MSERQNVVLLTPALDSRLAVLNRLSRDLSACGSVYLAALLVEEAYGRECMASVALGDGDFNAAALRCEERLRRVNLPVLALPSIDLGTRSERRARARRARKLTKEAA